MTVSFAQNFLQMYIKFSVFLLNLFEPSELVPSYFLGDVSKGYWGADYLILFFTYFETHFNQVIRLF